MDVLRVIERLMEEIIDYCERRKFKLIFDDIIIKKYRGDFRLFYNLRLFQVCSDFFYLKFIKQERLLELSYLLEVERIKTS